MFNRLSKLIEKTTPPNVYAWPTWARRTFLITIPISGPLWLLWCIVFSAVIIALGVIGMYAYLLSWIVVPVVAVFVWLWERAYELWHWKKYSA